MNNNQNGITKVVDYLVELLNADPLVNTISDKKTTEIDYAKDNIYPLVNLDLRESVVNPNTLVFSFIITVLEQRDIDNTLNNDKVYSSNMFDNLNECHSICVRLINILRKSNKYDINVDSVSNITMLKLATTKLTDGCRFTINLSISNDITSCY